MASLARSGLDAVAAPARASAPRPHGAYALVGARRSLRCAPCRVASIERPQKLDGPSLDPIAASLSTEDFVPGQVWTIHSPTQLQAALERHSDRLCVLMCKSKTCRPCKMFMKKYMDIAQRFPEVVLMQLYGDESAETRKLMVSMKVKVTPTFAMYRGAAPAGTVTGVSDVKLLRGIVDLLTPAELAGHEEDVFELEAAEKEAAAQEGAKQ